MRMVLTEEQQTDMYPAGTFEDRVVSSEQVFYDNVDVERVARRGSFFNEDANGSKVQLLRKSTQAIGVGKLLKVMAGDRLHVKVDYYVPNIRQITVMPIKIAFNGTSDVIFLRHHRGGLLATISKSRYPTFP